MTRRLSLTETGDPSAVTLSEAEASALLATGLVQATRTAVAGQWSVSAGRKIGAVRVGENLQVEVTSKVKIDRLVFMMAYARDPSFWRESPVTLPRETDLPETLAQTFCQLATRALENGLLHGYRTVDDSLHVVRGRIRADDQLRVRYQMPLPIEVRYDEYTADIAENQILLAAALCLLRLPRISSERRSTLQRLRLQLADVTPTLARTTLPEWRRSRLNTRYQPALHVAELVIAGWSFELDNPGANIEVSGFVFDGWKIFEDFVCVALSEAMADGTGSAEFQFRSRLDQSGSPAIAIEPDFTWWHASSPTAVVDAKYKAEKSSRFPNADVYQVLAYCTALKLAHGHLVYAKGEVEVRSYDIRNSRIKIHCHAVDLAVAPPQLLLQVRRLASRIQDPREAESVASSC